MKDKKSTETGYMPTYYDVAPEHNERMNVEGFRNFMCVIILLTISILLTCLL